MAPVLEKLRLPEEFLTYDLATVDRFLEDRRRARQWRDAADPARWPPLSQNAPEEDESAYNGDAMSGAIQACETIVTWFNDPASPVGAYLKRHPEMIDQRVRPSLWAITRIWAWARVGDAEETEPLPAALRGLQGDFCHRRSLE